MEDKRRHSQGKTKVAAHSQAAFFDASGTATLLLLTPVSLKDDDMNMLLLLIKQYIIKQTGSEKRKENNQ